MKLTFLIASLIAFTSCKKDSTSNYQTNSKFIGFNQNWSQMPALSTTMLNNISSLKPQMIRYPGGTVTHSWDWVQGIKTSGFSAAPHPISDILTFKNSINAELIFVLDILNKSIDDQILMLNSIKNLGIKINYIELGNELYSQDSSYISSFPTGAEYGAKVNIWTAKLKTAFPNSKVSALLQCRSSNASNQRLNQWNNLVVTSTINSVDAYTYHIYIPVGGSFQSRIQEFENVANNSNTSNKELWITEYGNQNDTTNPDYYNSLDSLANYVDSNSKITIALNHQIVSNNKSKITADGLYFTKEGQLFLTRASRR